MTLLLCLAAANKTATMIAVVMLRLKLSLMCWYRYGLVGSDSDDEAGPEPLQPRLTAEAKGKAAMFPAAKPAQTPSRPAGRGFTAAALDMSESDDDAELLEGTS